LPITAVMFIQEQRFQAIGAADERERVAHVDRLLADMLTGGTQADVPASCPLCRRDLVREPLAATGVYASRCPDGHGAWAPADAVEALRRFVDTHASAAARARTRLRVLTRVLLIAVVVAPVVFALSSGPEAWAKGIVSTVDWYYNRQVGPTSWPDRRWVFAIFSIPTKGSSIDDHAELLYFDRLLDVLNSGISNRLNMDGVLASGRDPREYPGIYAAYRERQLNVLADLGRLPVPHRLQPVHARILRATESQIEFYGSWAEARALNRSIGLAQMLGHPALKQANGDLLAAWGLIRQIYPRLDGETSNAIEMHLCAFDII
ncbi:MAG: hypothetical protein WED01_09105, partial [Candidatus Rokuibacteriota bacterium]